MNAKVHELLNVQINKEFYSAYLMKPVNQCSKAKMESCRWNCSLQ